MSCTMDFKRAANCSRVSSQGLAIRFSRSRCLIHDTPVSCGNATPLGCRLAAVGNGDGLRSETRILKRDLSPSESEGLRSVLKILLGGIAGEPWGNRLRFLGNRQGTALIFWGTGGEPLGIRAGTAYVFRGTEFWRWSGAIGFCEFGASKSPTDLPLYKTKKDFYSFLPAFNFTATSSF